MTRDDLLWVLNAFLDGTSQTDDLVFKAEQAVAWLEDDGNEDYFEHKGYLYTGWLLTSPE